MTTISSSTIKTRILCISDTHSGRPSPEWSRDGAFRPPFPKVDVLIHSGDLTLTGKPHEYREAIALLSSFEAELKLVIAGNHDLSLDEDYYLSGRGPGGGEYLGYAFDEDAPLVAKQLWTGSAAREAGVTYLEEGVHRFRLGNGARLTVYASPWQPEFFDWAFNYPHDEDRCNPPGLIAPGETCEKTGKVVKAAPRERKPNPILEGEEVDVVITHGPPWMHLDKCNDENGTRAGCPHLLKALERVRPKLHVFGHIHEGWGCEIVRWGGGHEDNMGPVGEATNVRGVAVGALKEVIRPTDKAVRDGRSAFVDVSKDGGHCLKAGEETVMVNASIVNVGYEAEYAPWLLDLELPKA